MKENAAMVGRRVRQQELLNAIKEHSGCPYELFVARAAFKTGLRAETIRSYLRTLEDGRYISVRVSPKGVLSIYYEGEATAAYEPEGVEYES